MLNLLFIVLGMVLLILGGNLLLKAAVAFSLRLLIPKIVIGMTVVSLATSAPELVVSVQAALEGFPDLALGNVVGSNIANLGLVLGITVLLGPIEVLRSFYTTDWPVMMAASLLFSALLWYDGVLGALEGGILLGMLFIFLVYLLRFQKTAVAADGNPEIVALPLYRAMLFLGLGGLALWAGSAWLVQGAVGLATYFGVSDRVIGISVVAVGTSIPELAASVIAMIRNEKAISVGNLIGSNIFNILAVLGLTALITPVRVVDARLLSNDIPWMLVISFLILPLVFLPEGRRLGWRDGLVLLSFYVLFLYRSFWG